MSECTVVCYKMRWPHHLAVKIQCLKTRHQFPQTASDLGSRAQVCISFPQCDIYLRQSFLRLLFPQFVMVEVWYVKEEFNHSVVFCKYTVDVCCTNSSWNPKTSSVNTSTENHPEPRMVFWACDELSGPAWLTCRCLNLFVAYGHSPAACHGQSVIDAIPWAVSGHYLGQCWLTSVRAVPVRALQDK